MKSTYHAGELAVQARVGVEYEASRVGTSIRSAIPLVAQEFLRNQRLAIMGSVDARGRVWASALTGEPGFMTALSETALLVTASPAQGDPLEENLRSVNQIGMLAIELETRRRMRLNGTVDMRPAGGFVITTEQVYSNCPKYIQKRSFEPAVVQSSEEPEVRRSAVLTAEQRRWVEGADTLFIATYHPTGGADASHRGGLPGFVRVVSDTTLVIPDYYGNNMFQTLGNMEAYPATGLLFIDFETGDTLQMTGKARVVWDQKLTATFPGAQRLVEFEIEETVEVTGASRLRGRLVEYSPFNPS